MDNFRLGAFALRRVYQASDKTSIGQMTGFLRRFRFARKHMKQDLVYPCVDIDSLRIGQLSSIRLLDESESNDLSNERFCDLWSDITLQVIEHFNAEKLLMQQIKIPEIICFQQRFEQNKFMEELIQVHFEIMHFVAPPLEEVVPVWIARFKQHVAGFDFAMKKFVDSASNA